MLEKEQINVIIESIKSLEERFKRISEAEKISQIEIDLSLSKIQFLYEEVLNLDKLIKTKVVKDDPLKTKQQKNEEKKSIEQPVNDKKSSTEFVSKELPTEKEEKITIPISDIVDDKKNIHENIIKDTSFEIITSKEEIKQADVVPEDIKTQPEIILKTEKNTESEIKTQDIKKEKIEISSSDNLSVNDLLAKNLSGKNIANKLKNKPIKSINEAIGLNDKFLFIRELFNGQADLFSKTVEQLNKLDSFELCIDYINSNFAWDFEEANVIKFLEIVNRRFIQ